MEPPHISVFLFGITWMQHVVNDGLAVEFQCIGLPDRQTFLVWIISSGGNEILVYETPVNSAEELVARISAAAGEIRNTPEMFSNVRRSMKRRIESHAAGVYRSISKRNRRTTAQQVANQFLAASGKQISRKTVARRLRGGGLYARRPVVCITLTRQHRTARLQWCREHHNWTEQDRACVLFSDESRFSLSSDCRRQLIWRESGTAYRPENIQEKDRYPTCSIMVWAGIMMNGCTRLHVVAIGTMTGQRYIDEVLLPHVRLFRGAVGDKYVFMDDNATCHRTLAVQDCLDSEGIQRLVWPARSPDLNPIENVWDALGRQDAGRNYPVTNKNTLIRALTEEWYKLPQQLLDNVVQKQVKGLVIFSDSKAALQTILNGGSCITEDVCPRLFRLQELGKVYFLQWLLAHVDITGNENADKLVKEARNLNNDNFVKVTLLETMLSQISN
ncbi:transposable element Tcb2 transposase [Trichonephila clavipes]|nr:transposable element Tcb2 transposase [Trichonephila clavipes]